MPVTWSVGARVRPRVGSREHTWTVQKIIVVRRHGIIRKGIHLYMIKNIKTGQTMQVKGEALVHA